LKDILERFFKYYFFKNNGLGGHVWLLIAWLDLYVSIVIACFFQHLKMGLHVIINGEHFLGSSKNIQLHAWNYIGSFSLTKMKIIG